MPEGRFDLGLTSIVSSSPHYFGTRLIMSDRAPSAYALFCSEIAQKRVKDGRRARGKKVQMTRADILEKWLLV